MSNLFYNKIWDTTQKELEHLAHKDYENQAQDPQLDRLQAQRGVFQLYLHYITIANKLEEVYDKMLQPQKRILVKKILDACLGRVVELKHDLVNIDMMEFSYNEEIMEKLQLTPLDIDLQIPKYFRREREKEILERRQFIDDILIKLGWLEEHAVEEKLTEIEAIRLIQIHERARQGRLRAHFMKEIKMLKEKGKPDSLSRAETSLMAALRIQKMWRGYAVRRKTRRRKMEEMILIGMVPLSPASSSIFKKSEAFEKMNEDINRRYKTQSEYKEKFDQAMTETREEIKIKLGPNLMEDIGDDIRAWIKDQYEKTGKIPDFPTEDHGGSRHLFSRQGTESGEMSRSSAISSKESRKTAKDKLKSPPKSGDINVNDDILEGGFRPTQSTFLPEIKSGIDEYHDTWRDKDESTNLRQRHYEDMVYSEKYTEVEIELRKIVDDLMRQELEQLQAAIGKKAKKSGKKARRSGKKSKKKKEKDLTPDRTTESLFEELVTNGIVRQYPETYLNSYIGERACCQRDGTNPALGDIKQLLKEYCILPLGSEHVRNNCPCIRSILLTGPKGTGKKSLLHAICTEVGAILFDLTPANIVGKYPGKSGLIMLIHLILKVSRLLQPAVIYMDDAEKPFMKKIPKTDRTDPKRLKKDLLRIIKNIQVEDRVIFIGTSQQPWEADQKLLQQTYNRFIYIPRPDYGTLSYAWKEIINQHTGGYIPFDTFVMAKISDGYTIGSIVSSVNDVMTCKRKLQLNTLPLTHVEFINVLSTKDPVYKEEEEAFQQWWSKTPLGRRRQRVLELEEEARRELENANGKKKKRF